MAKPFNDKRFGLGEPYASMLADFSAANYNAPAIEIIREAVKDHIERRLEEPELFERYQRARQARIDSGSSLLRLVDEKNGR